MDSFIAVAGWAQHTSPQPGSRPFGHFRSLSSIARSPSPSPKATRITGKTPSVADVPIMSSSLASTPSSPSLRPTPVSPPEDEGELSTLPDPRSRAMSPASDADTSHHPDLDDEVATLSTKLINAINHQTTLDDTLTATRQELERAREQIKHLEEQNASQREMLAGDIWVRRKVVEEEKKTILLRVTNERKLREDVEKEKKKIEQELENLTTALFEEANNMVISAKEEARIEQEALQRKNDNLRSQLGDMEALLTSQQQQLADLKHVMEQMALEREEGTTGTAPSSPGFSKSEFKDDERPDGVLASPLVDPSSPTYPTSLTHLIQPVLRTDLGSYEDFVALTRISRNRAGSRVSSGSFNGISGLGLGMGGSTSSAHPSNASTASLSTAGTPASSSPQTPNTPASVSSTASANLGPPPPALKETKFFKRVLAEDVEPTLRLDIAPGLSWLARRSVLNAMSDGSIVVEPIPANAPFAAIVKPREQGRAKASRRHSLAQNSFKMRQLLAALLFLCLAAFGTAADYHEQLNLRPLPLSALLASFNFRSNTSLADFESQNFRYFPRSLGQILQYAGTRELHLRFSLGRWDAESWGGRPWDGQREGGTGVELWAWLEAETDEEADQKWLTLTNALSGLFCASLNFVDGTRTTRPVMSFQPEGDHPEASIPNMQLLHGVLPKEVVCTENLTPFLKLLPCKGKAGISSLLDGHKLFDSSFQSMAIDIKPVCPEGQECVLQIEQTIDMVLDIDRSKRPRDNPIPRPPPGHELKCDTSKPYHSDDTCYPISHSLGQDWTLSQLFGKTVKGVCPLTDEDVPPVCIEVPHSRGVFTSGGATEILNPNGVSRCFKFGHESELEIVLPLENKEGHDAADELVEPATPLIYAERSFTGHGQEHGGMQAILTNPSKDTEVEFIYMESLPWFMRVYLHTLNARIEGSAGSQPSIVEDIYYRPAVDRARGTQLELRMRIPPASTVFLTYDFEKSILRYTEYPPDANRGFDIAAAVITTLSPRTQSTRTTTLLLNLPTPDFSMPYNVIIFTSTAIALAFGGMYNILVRRLVGADEGPSPVLKAKLGRLLGKLKGRVSGKK